MAQSMKGCLLRIPQTLFNKIQNEHDQDDRSFNYIFIKICKWFLESQPVPRLQADSLKEYRSECKPKHFFDIPTELHDLIMKNVQRDSVEPKPEIQNDSDVKRRGRPRTRIHQEKKLSFNSRCVFMIDTYYKNKDISLETDSLKKEP